MFSKNKKKPEPKRKHDLSQVNEITFIFNKFPNYDLEGRDESYIKIECW